MKKVISIILVIGLLFGIHSIDVFATNDWSTNERKLLLSSAETMLDSATSVVVDVMSVVTFIEYPTMQSSALSYFNNVKTKLNTINSKLESIETYVNENYELVFNDIDGKKYYLKESFNETVIAVENLNNYTFSSLTTASVAEEYQSAANEILFACTKLNSIAKNGVECYENGDDVDPDYSEIGGTSVSNAIELKNDVWHTRGWTNANYSQNCYNKIVVPHRGYITFNISKPYDAKNKISYYILKLYNGGGELVWTASTYSYKNIFEDNYTFKIGLLKGTYYMVIDPGFAVNSNAPTVLTKHKYTFTKSDDWEVESNNNLATATQLTLGKSCNGFYKDEASDLGYTDCFKIYLKKGSRYKLSFYNYNNLISGTTIIDFLDPNSEKIRLSSSDGRESGNSKYWNIDTEKTGWYYLKIRNECNEEGVSYQIKVEEVQKIKVSTLKIKLSKTSCTYNGKAQKPTISVKDSKGKTVASNNYTVKYASGCRNVGKYKVTVTFKGNYSGTKTLYFTINPVKTSITKLTAAKKALTVSISKKSSQVTGYEIQYATNKKFSKAKTRTVKSYKTTKVTIKKLSAKKTYYVRVRTYKTVGKTKYYSGWSTVKKIKTK